MVFVATLGLDWIDDAVDGVGGLLSWILAPLKTLFHWLWAAMVNFVSPVFHWLAGLFDQAWSTIWANFDSLWSLAEDLWQSAVNIAAAALDQLRQWVTDAIDAAVTWATDIYHWAQAAIAQAEDWAHSAVDWIVNDLIDPLSRWVAAAADWVWHVLDGWWQTIYNDVIRPIEQAADWAWHELSSIWDWLTHDVAAVVELVVKAAEWLVWMGEHTISELVDILEGKRSLINRETLLGQVGQYPHTWDAVGEIFDRILS